MDRNNIDEFCQHIDRKRASSAVKTIVMPTANELGGLNVERDVMADNLATVLAAYFERHEERPDNDPTDSELGWGAWTIEKTNEALEYLREQLEA